MNWKRWLLLITLLHFVFAVAYASLTPYRTAGILRFQGGAPSQDIGAPDERQHANYIQYVMDGNGFPVFKPDDPNLYETYQRHQPPLYYFLSAGVGKITGQTDVEQRNTGLTLRAFNALIGAIGIAGIFFVGLWGFKNAWIGLSAAAFAALLPMNIALSAAITNDVLLIALCSWTLALASRAARDGWSLKQALFVGLLGGLALLTKTSAIALIPAVFFAFLLRKEDKGWKLELKPLAIAAFAMLVLIGPWWVRNQKLYGDPLAQKAFSQAFTNSAIPADLIVPSLLQTDQQYAEKANKIAGANPQLQGRELLRKVAEEEGLPPGAVYDYSIRWVFWWTFRSFIGVFGYMDIFLPSVLYAILGLGFLGILLMNIPNRRNAEIVEARPVRTMLTVFFVVVALLFIRFNMQYFQAQARYLLPAIASVSACVGCGLIALAKDKKKQVIGVFICILIALNLYVLSVLPGEFKQRESNQTVSFRNYQIVQTV